MYHFFFYPFFGRGAFRSKIYSYYCHMYHVFLPTTLLGIPYLSIFLVNIFFPFVTPILICHIFVNINIEQHIWACGIIIAYKIEYIDPSATWEQPIAQKGKLRLFEPVLTIFCRPSANKCSCCKFITAMLLPCPENSISLFLCSLHFFWPLFKIS